MPAICISHFWSSIFPVALVDCLWLSFITQGTVLDRIDYNVEQSCIKTEDGLKQLHKVMAYFSVAENLKNCFPISRIHTRLVFCLNCPRHFPLSSALDGAVKMQPVMLFRAHHVGCGHLPEVSESRCTPHAELKLLRTPICDSKLWKSQGFLPFRKYFIPWLGPLVLGNRSSGYLLKSMLHVLSAGSCWLRPPLLWYFSDELLVGIHSGEVKNLIFSFNYHSISVYHLEERVVCWSESISFLILC